MANRPRFTAEFELVYRCVKCFLLRAASDTYVTEEGRICVDCRPILGTPRRRRRAVADLNDYRCIEGHVFAAPNAPHGGPWATLVCPECGATACRHFGCEHVDDETFNGRWCAVCDPGLGGDKGSA